jgi:arylsulfatase A-like enzyme
MSDAAPKQPSANAPLHLWLGPGLLAAGISALVRLIGQSSCRVHHLGTDPEFATLTTLGQLPEVLIHATILCCAAAILLRPASATPRRLAARAFATLLFASALTGWPLAAPTDLAAFAAPLGPANLPTLIGLALCLTPLVELLPRRFDRPLPTALLVLLGALGPGLWIIQQHTAPPTYEAHVVVADLLSESERWTLDATHPTHKPKTGVLTPWVDYEIDGGDKPALIMPPPCEASFTILPEDGPVRLRLSAGVDHSVDTSLPTTTAQAAFAFEVLVDGELAYETIIEVTRGAREGAQRAWRHPAQDIDLVPGQSVTLRTRVAAGAAVEEAGCRVGFGTLVLERAVSYPRRLATPERPSIILVVMDTQRADRMSCYGYRDLTTPHTDALAARGMLFDSAYSTSSWTWPATASILTGLVPEEHGVLSKDSCTLALSNESIAEALSEVGYSTGAFSCNPLIAPERYFDQGFESFDSAPKIRHTAAIIDAAEAWITARAGARFFLYLHLADPHTPHEPLPAELQRLGHTRPVDYVSIEHEGNTYDRMDLYARNLLRPGAQLSEEVPDRHAEWIHGVYDASIATGDHYLGRILTRLDELGLRNTTVVALTSDHGEELFDHGRLAHGHTLHTELVRVPLIIAGPGVPERRVSQPISNRHLAPTLARIGGAGLRHVTDPQLLFADDLQPQILTYQTGKGIWGDERGQRLFGIREGDWILHYNADAPARPTALFDLNTDPREQIDLSLEREHRATRTRLTEQLQRTVQAARERRRGVAIGVGSGGASDLRGIGYTQVLDEVEDL